MKIVLYEIVVRTTIFYIFIKAWQNRQLYDIFDYSSVIGGRKCDLWGLDQVTYILCLERLRLLHLSRESNPGPPALQANTLCQIAI
jgi:hypothetical protein